VVDDAFSADCSDVGQWDTVRGDNSPDDLAGVHRRMIREHSHITYHGVEFFTGGTEPWMVDRIAAAIHVAVALFVLHCRPRRLADGMRDKGCPTSWAAASIPTTALANRFRSRPVAVRHCA